MKKDYRNTNLLQETIEILEGLDKGISWARIHCEGDAELPQEEIVLAPSHSQEDLENFYRSLNFNYDSSYGSQHIYGYIVFIDNTWLARGEYDGAEWWEYNKCPKWKEED